MAQRGRPTDLNREARVDKKREGDKARAANKRMSARYLFCFQLTDKIYKRLINLI